MKITHLGASTIIVEHKKKRIMFDPWLDDGIVYGAWYRWPPSKILPTSIGKLDYIIISHIHEDHCSPGTIKHLDKNAEVIIMDRRPNFVKKFLDYNKFKFKKNDILLFGRESAGVPVNLHKTIKNKVKIPMNKNTRSLNVAMSVAIISAEALRQNNLLK